MGRPGVPPGIYFRLLLTGYFEGIGLDGSSHSDVGPRRAFIVEFAPEGVSSTMLEPTPMDDILAA